MTYSDFVNKAPACAGFVLGLLTGSWVVISGVTTRVSIAITPIKGLRTLLIATHEPPSKV